MHTYYKFYSDFHQYGKVKKEFKSRQEAEPELSITLHKFKRFMLDEIVKRNTSKANFFNLIEIQGFLFFISSNFEFLTSMKKNLLKVLVCFSYSKSMAKFEGFCLTTYFINHKLLITEECAGQRNATSGSIIIVFFNSSRALLLL